MTLPQFVALDTIKRHGPHTVLELIKLTGIDRATFFLMLARMREDGLVENGPPAPSVKPGPAPKVLCLSSKGRRALLASEPILWKAEKKLLEALTPQQRSQFLDALGVVAYSGPKP